VDNTHQRETKGRTHIEVFHSGKQQLHTKKLVLESQSQVFAFWDENAQKQVKEYQVPESIEAQEMTRFEYAIKMLLVMDDS
jgi:hypothetical protein